jgi:chromosomal replication initiation ATPase DnaA
VTARQLEEEALAMKIRNETRQLKVMRGKTFMPERHRIKVDQICEFHGTSLVRLLNGDRLQETINARRDSCYYLRSTGASLPCIGRWMGIDHTTVMYHLRASRIKPAKAVEPEEWKPDESGAWAI